MISEKLKLRYLWIFLLVLLLVPLSCYSKKNKTENRARERVTKFVFLMVKDKVEQAEELLASGMIYSGNKELFLASFDNWQLKDTTDVVIEFQHIFIPEDDPKNRALVSMTVRSQKNDFTKMVSMPVTYEKGDWYIGS